MHFLSGEFIPATWSWRSVTWVVQPLCSSSRESRVGRGKHGWRDGDGRIDSESRSTLAELQDAHFALMRGVLGWSAVTTISAPSKILESRCGKLLSRRMEGEAIAAFTLHHMQWCHVVGLPEFKGGCAIQMLCMAGQGSIR